MNGDNAYQHVTDAFREMGDVAAKAAQPLAQLDRKYANAGREAKRRADRVIAHSAAKREAATNRIRHERNTKLSTREYFALITSIAQNLPDKDTDQ